MTRMSRRRSHHHAPLRVLTVCRHDKKSPALGRATHDETGAPCRTRTCNQCLRRLRGRSPLFYPIELMAQKLAPGAFHPVGLSGTSPAGNQTSAFTSVIDLPRDHAAWTSASLRRCAMPLMAATFPQPDAKLCCAMRLTIKSAHCRWVCAPLTDS